MRIFELEKPKTPEQLRLDQLRATSKRASDALKIERDRQKGQRAQKNSAEPAHAYQTNAAVIAANPNQSSLRLIEPITRPPFLTSKSP